MKRPYGDGQESLWSDRLGRDSKTVDKFKVEKILNALPLRGNVCFWPFSPSPTAVTSAKCLNLETLWTRQPNTHTHQPVRESRKRNVHTDIHKSWAS